MVPPPPPPPAAPQRARSQTSGHREVPTHPRTASLRSPRSLRRPRSRSPQRVALAPPLDVSMESTLAESPTKREDDCGSDIEGLEGVSDNRKTRVKDRQASLGIKSPEILDSVGPLLSIAKRAEGVKEAWSAAEMKRYADSILDVVDARLYVMRTVDNAGGDWALWRQFSQSLSVGSTKPGARLSRDFKAFTEKQKAEKQLASGSVQRGGGSSARGGGGSQPFRGGSGRDGRPTQSQELSGWSCYNCGEEGHVVVQCTKPNTGGRYRWDSNRNFRDKRDRGGKK